MAYNEIPVEGDVVIFNKNHPENINPIESDEWFEKVKDDIGEIQKILEVKKKNSKCGVFVALVEFSEDTLPYELTRFQKTENVSKTFYH